MNIHAKVYDIERLKENLTEGPVLTFLYLIFWDFEQILTINSRNKSL